VSVASDSAIPSIRPMLDSDLTRVMEIEEAVYPFGWTEGIFRDCLRVQYSCWVMLMGGEIIGYAIMSVAVGEAHVLNVAVDEQYQGQGHGRSFMRYLMETARHHGADTAFLEVRPSNRSAIHLYETLGFNQVGLRRDYYPAMYGKEDAIIMACSLPELDS
jgi:[ribosomal protein S18]-alanine N-acetyltransferase